MSTFFEPGKTYNFSTYAPGRLGQDHNNMTCIAVSMYSGMLRDFPDLVETYTIVQPNLPVGTPNDYRLPRYIEFKDSNGNKKYFADIWIIPSSIKLVVRQYGTFKVADSHFTTADVPLLLRLLASYGYNDVTYTVSDYKSEA